MRYINLMHTLYIGLLLVIDAAINVAVSQFGFPFSFVSSLSFIGLLLLARNDTIGYVLIRCVLLSLWLDLNHVASIPLFLISMSVASFVVYRWYKHIGSSYLELSVLVLAGLFIKEIVLYGLLRLYNQYNASLALFFVERTFWIVLLNTALIPIAYRLFQWIHQLIAKRTLDVFRR